LIEKNQRRFITRMIPDFTYGDRLAKLKLWSLEDRRIRADSIEYKMVHGLSSVKLETFFEVDYMVAP